MKEYLAMFDLDGTLFQTDEVNFLAYRQALTEVGISLERRVFESWKGLSYRQFLPTLLNEETLVEKVHELKKQFYSQHLSAARPNEHLLRMIELMSPRYHIALVTTASRQNAMELLSCFGIQTRFEYLVTQEDVQNVKPDPEAYFMAMRQFSIAPAHCIIFEDSPIGLEAAKKSGATVFMVDQFVS